MYISMRYREVRKYGLRTAHDGQRIPSVVASFENLKAIDLIVQ